MRRMDGCSTRRASTTCPSTHARFGIATANDIRTWKAMRVLSGSTVTGPHARTRSSSASYSARISGGLPLEVRIQAVPPARVRLVAVREPAAARGARPQAAIGGIDGHRRIPIVEMMQSLDCRAGTERAFSPGGQAHAGPAHPPE
jgi:hypothetical protein